MCKQKAVLEAIKKTKGRGGMTPAQIELAEAQTADYQELKREVIETKKTAEETKSELEYVRGQVDLLVKNSNSKTSHFFQFVLELVKVVIELIHTKSFWTLLTVFSVLYLCGKYNINPADLFKHLFGG